MQNDNNLSNLTMSKSNVNPVDTLFRIEQTSSIQFLPRIIEDIDKPNNETRCTIEEIDQPGSSLSADVSSTACGTEEPSRLSINATGPLVLYNSKDKPRKLHTYHDGLQLLSLFEKRRICPYSRNFRKQSVYIAAATNNVEAIKRLLEKGESPNNTSDKHKHTPLHIACDRGYTEIVSLLLKYNADVNRRNWMGSTPLHIAAATCNTSIVMLLLSAGTDPLSINNNGDTPLKIAETNLKFVRLYNGDDMHKGRAAVNNIVNILWACQGAGQDVEALSNFCSRLSLSNTTDQVQDE